MSAIGLHILTDPHPATLPATAPNLDAHPLDTPLRQVTALRGRTRAALGLAGRSLDAWALATELADPAADRLERGLRRVGVRAGTADRLVMVSLFFGSYVSQLAIAALGCYLLAQRVPDLSAENVAVHIDDDGRVDEVRFLGGGFAAVPTDRAADHPDAVVVPDLAALRETLVRGLTSGHLDELILTLGTRRGLGTRALWAAVEDGCMGALIWLSQHIPSAVDIEHEAQTLGCTPPFVGACNVQPKSVAGGSLLTMTRGFCCLAYRLDGHRPCQTCPLLAAARPAACLAASAPRPTSTINPA